MSRPTPSQQAAIDAARRANVRAVQAHEAALLRAAGYRRRVQLTLLVLCVFAIAAGTAVVHVAARGDGEHAATSQGRAR